MDLVQRFTHNLYGEPPSLKVIRFDELDTCFLDERQYDGVQGIFGSKSPTEDTHRLGILLSEFLSVPSQGVWQQSSPCCSTS